MNRNYSETSMISIPADKNNKAIILDVGGKKHKIRGTLAICICYITHLHSQLIISTFIRTPALENLSRPRNWMKFLTCVTTSALGSLQNTFLIGEQFWDARWFALRDDDYWQWVTDPSDAASINLWYFQSCQVLRNNYPHFTVEIWYLLKELALLQFHSGYLQNRPPPSQQWHVCPRPSGEYWALIGPGVNDNILIASAPHPDPWMTLALVQPHFHTVA